MTLIIDNQAEAGFTWKPKLSLFGLLVRNVILQFVTLGIYRFWARTNLRRYFWSATEFSGEPFEYSGRGSELFVGFLLAMAFLAPLFGALYIAETFFGQETLGYALFQLAWLTLIVFLVNVGIFMSRRYLLTRTLWRGIRAGQAGSAIHYAFLSMGLSVLNFITLGMIGPWVRYKRQAYLMRNTLFGAQAFVFAPSVKNLFASWYVAWTIAAVILGAIILSFAYSISFEHIQAIHEGNPFALEDLLTQLRGPFIFSFVGFIVIALAFTGYYVREWREYVQASRLGDVRFLSTLGLGHILKLALLYAAGFLIIMGGGIGLYAMGILELLNMGSWGLAIGYFVAAIVLFAVGGYFLSWMLLYRGLAKRLAQTTRVLNVPALDRLLQGQAQTPRFGEGLADALDAGAFG